MGRAGNLKDDKVFYSTISVDVFKVGVLVLMSEDRESIIESLPGIYKKLGLSAKLADDDFRAIKTIWEKEKEECVSMPPGEAFMLNNPSQDLIVIFRGNNLAELGEEVIVHEMYHTMKNICTRCGVEDEETEAYILEHLFHKMLCMIDDYIKKHPKESKESV